MLSEEKNNARGSETIQGIKRTECEARGDYRVEAVEVVNTGDKTKYINVGIVPETKYFAQAIHVSHLSHPRVMP